MLQMSVGQGAPALQLNSSLGAVRALKMVSTLLLDDPECSSVIEWDDSRDRASIELDTAMCTRRQVQRSSNHYFWNYACADYISAAVAQFFCY